MKVLKTSLFIIGAVIGAGFATGKEIFTYFAKYGAWSLLFIIPLFFCLYYFNYTYLRFGSKFADFDLKKSNKLICKNHNIGKISYNPLDVMLFLTFLIHASAMFSGLVALCETYLTFGNKFIYFIIAIAVTIILVKTSFKFFSTLSNIVVPMIVICILLNAFCSFTSGKITTSFGINNLLPLPFLCIAYAAQNTFFSSFVVIKLGKDMTIKEQKQTSFVVAFILCTLITIGILCFLFNPKLIYSEIPFAEIAISINPIFSGVFAIILLFAILTTHATTLTSLKEYFKGEKKYNNTLCMICIIALLSLMNFGKIVEYLYPVIGMFGIVYFYKVLKFQTLPNTPFDYKQVKPTKILKVK